MRPGGGFGKDTCCGVGDDACVLAVIQSGLCSHILLVTHEEMKCTPRERRKAICNLNYMTDKIHGSKKKKGGSHTVKDCLTCEDSSDDDDDDDGPPLALRW